MVWARTGLAGWLGSFVSIQRIFAKNLRILCEGKPSVSAIARDLDISHVQFHRFLRGEAVPKPAVLKRICDYFGVDSRILTATLDEIETSGLAVQAEGLRPEMAQMFGFVLRGEDYSVPSGKLADGLYRLWTRDATDTRLLVCFVLQVRTVAGVRQLRFYHGRWVFPKTGGPDIRRQREVRGAVLDAPDGLVFLFFHPRPVHRISMVHFQQNPTIADGSMIGYVALGRGEIQGFGRLSRCYLEPVQPGFGNMLALARMKKRMTQEDVPPIIWEYVSQRLID